MSKDLIILTGKTEFTYQDIEGYFQDKVFLNYLNELVIHGAQLFEKVLIERAGVRQAYFTQVVGKHEERNLPFMAKALRAARFLDLDSIYF